MWWIKSIVYLGFLYYGGYAIENGDIPMGVAYIGWALYISKDWKVEDD